MNQNHLDNNSVNYMLQACYAIKHALPSVNRVFYFSLYVININLYICLNKILNFLSLKRNFYSHLSNHRKLEIDR